MSSFKCDFSAWMGIPSEIVSSCYDKRIYEREKERENESNVIPSSVSSAYRVTRTSPDLSRTEKSNSSD